MNFIVRSWIKDIVRRKFPIKHFFIIIINNNNNKVLSLQSKVG